MKITQTSNPINPNCARIPVFVFTQILGENMKASEEDFSFIASIGRFDIPFFQRTYVWRKKEEWQPFFESLLDSYKQNQTYFLGSIILQEMPTSKDSRESSALVIDGQQRLTTFSILIKALYDTLKDADRADYQSYLFKKPLKEKNPKIKHSRLDEPHFVKILQAQTSKDLGKEDSCLVQAYIYFSRQIQTEKEKNNLNEMEFLDFLATSKLWVVIRLEAEEDAQKIFDSINTTGQKLSATDIIKNALFDKAKSLGCAHVKLYENYWESVFEPNEDQRKFWEQEMKQGQPKRIQSEMFFHALAIIRGFVGEKSTFSKLSEDYKKHIKTLSKEQLEELLQEIHRYALLYQALPHNYEGELSFNDVERRLFNTMCVSKTQSCLPLVLYLKGLGDQELMQQGFHWLEILILTHWLCGGIDKDFSDFLAKIVHELRKKEAQGHESLLQTLKERLLQRKLGEAQIANALKSSDGELRTKNTNNNKPTLLLFTLELHRLQQNNRNGSLKYKYSLEHLMPQKWKEHWADIVGGDSTKAESLIYQVGNMALLEKDLNAAMRNKAWEDKRGYLRSEQDSLPCTTQEVLDIGLWDAEEIEKRTESLTQEFLGIVRTFS